MYKVKQFIKRVLIFLHLWKRPEVFQTQEKKQIPDFDFSSRREPVFVMKAGEYLEQLDNKEKPLIAVQVHAFFLDVMEEIADILNSVPYPFDCYVSTDTKEKKNAIERLLAEKCKIHYLQVDVMGNRGRDVGPFLQQMEPVIHNYKYLAHLHTKKSKHTDFGDDWRHFLFRNLFGGRQIISAILEKFERDERLGLIIPEVYPIVRELMGWDTAKDDVQKLLTDMGLRAQLPEVPICPVGDFFWARTDAVKILFEQKIKQSDFQEEAGQIQHTLAHVIERIWCYMVEAQGYRYEVCVNGINDNTCKKRGMRRAAIYACGEEITTEDFYTIKKLVDSFEMVLPVVKDKDVHREVMEKTGFDASIYYTNNYNQMWENALVEKKELLQEIDEVALIDNSGVGPLFDLRPIMDCMSEMDSEGWSIFKTNISKAIFSIINLKKVGYEATISMIQRDVVLQNVYVKESAYIGEWLFAEDPITELAFDYVILHTPFVKKVSTKNTRENEKYLIDKFLQVVGII